MLLSKLPTAELVRLIKVSERSQDPDEHALRSLWEELMRRLGENDT